MVSLQAISYQKIPVLTTNEGVIECRSYLAICSFVIFFMLTSYVSVSVNLINIISVAIDE